MHDNWMVSVAAVCRARTDILCAEPVFQAAGEHEVAGGPGAGAVGLLVAWAALAHARSGRRGWRAGRWRVSGLGWGWLGAGGFDRGSV